MKENFDYKQVPGNYLHCLYTPCPRSAECLRFLVTRHIDSEIKFISVVNPTYIIGKKDMCPYFHKDSLTCFALGITHLFDNLPYSKALKIKKMLYHHLKRNTYYRILRKERQIIPAELAIIREIFRREGIKEEPVFDELIYKYDWNSET